jgi:Uma2 family endonuclease
MPVRAVACQPLLPYDAGPLTVDDWFALPETPDRYELDEGMLVMAPPPGSAHQDAAGAIYVALVIASRAVGGWAMPAPTGVVLSPSLGYEPDVLYLSPDRMLLKTRRGVEGAPDIVVEVLSRGTRTYDLQTKLPAYLAHGVREVWIVDPEAKTVAVHRAGAEPESCAFGRPIPSRLIDVGTADLDRLPELRE